MDRYDISILCVMAVLAAAVIVCSVALAYLRHLNI